MKHSSQLTILLISLALSLEVSTSYAQPSKTPIYKNPSYTVKQRIDDLISRMTLEEKVGQMNMPCVYQQRIGWGMDVGTAAIHGIRTPEERIRQMEGCRKFTRGNHNNEIGPGGGFFTLADRAV